MNDWDEKVDNIEKTKTANINNGIDVIQFHEIVGLIVGLSINIALYIFLYYKFEGDIGYEGRLGAFTLVILFSIIGICMWAIFWLKYKKLLTALGFLIGGFSTILIFFLLPSSLP